MRVYDNLSAVDDAKQWIKAERQYFIEHLADELGTMRLARAVWRKIKDRANNPIELEAAMELIYDDPTEIATYL